MPHMAPAPSPPEQRSGGRGSVSTAAFQSNIRQECAICYDVLPDRPCAVLIDEHGSRCCRHYFHVDCAKRLVSSSRDKTCPLCRKVFKASQRMPDIKTSPHKWFKRVDFDSSVLLRDDVLDALGAVLQVDVAKLDSALDVGLWSQWDPDMNGITIEEFKDPINGLLQWVLRKMPVLQHDALVYPDIFDGQSAWFDFWDTQQKECLTKSELLRAIAKSYGLELDEVETMRLVLDHCWDTCSLTLRILGTEVVTKSVFCGSFGDLLTKHLRELWGPGIRRRMPSTQASGSSLDGASLRRPSAERRELELQAEHYEGAEADGHHEHSEVSKIWGDWNRVIEKCMPGGRARGHAAGREWGTGPE